MVGIYIEGDGRLREGFKPLLEKLASNVNFYIIMGKGIRETIPAFKNHQSKNGAKLLLIDLDMLDNRRNERLKERALDADRDNVFFMIQEMEAWFLSQQQMLNEHYGRTLQYPAGHAKDIGNPKQILKNITNSLRNKYAKVSDAIELLKKLDVDMLARDFDDVASLRTRLLSYNP